MLFNKIRNQFIEINSNKNYHESNHIYFIFILYINAYNCIYTSGLRALSTFIN